MTCSHCAVLCCAVLCCTVLCVQQLAVFKTLPTPVPTLFCLISGAMPKQARITGSQTRHDSLTDPPPPRSSSSVPAATHPASPQSAAQQNLSHGLSPPKLDQLSSELPLKQSVSHPPAMTHPPAVTHPPTASAQQPPANAAPPRSSLKLPSQLPPQLPSQLPSQLPPATEAPACSNDEKEVQQWHDLQKQKADALMAKVLSTRTGDRSGKDLTDEELAQFQSQLLEQAREEAKKLPDRLHPAKPPPCSRNLPPPPKQAAHHLPNPLQLELVRVDPLQPYNCREPPQRFSSLAGALQLITKGVVNPVAVHAAAALHARGATILHRRKYESLDAAVFWVVLKECRAKPTNKQYADALLKATRNKVCASTISSGAKMLSDDSAFVSALKTELSRLTEQPKRTAKEISSSPVTVSKPGPMPSSKSTKRSREDNPADLSRESAHMGPHVTSAGQEATKLSSAADEESPRPENKKMCFGVGQPSSGAVSQVGDSSKHAGDYNTICGDLANDAAIAGVPFNPTSGDYICITLHSAFAFLAFLVCSCLA